jgi:hypothetical protein
MSFFARLFFKCLRDVRSIEKILLFEAVAGSGLRKESVEQFIRTLLGDASKFRLANWDRTIIQEPGCKKQFKKKNYDYVRTNCGSTAKLRTGRMYFKCQDPLF